MLATNYPLLESCRCRVRHQKLMSALNWAALVVAVLSILASILGAIRYMVKQYLVELKPNGGSSMNDRLNRLESRVDSIYVLLVERQ